jgi:hypothetical protein
MAHTCRLKEGPPVLPRGRSGGVMARRLEIRIPISPTDDYFNRIHLIAHAVRSLGGDYADTHIRVTVGADAPARDLHKDLPWSKKLGIEWKWIQGDEFTEWRATAHPYIATMMERFRPPFNAANVLMLDADVVAMQPFDEWLSLVERQPGIAGVMAHVAPFGDTAGAWNLLFQKQGLTPPAFTYEHSGWGLMDNDPARRYGPPYYNTGVLLAPAALLEKLYEPYMKALWSVRATLDSYFFEQIALTLALYSADIPFHVSPVRYNFPNQQAFDQRYPEELAHIRFLHFLRTDIVKREADFETLEATRALVARTDLTGSNELFRARVAQLLPAMIADRAGA